MHYEEFVGRVQHKARLGTMGDTVTCIRATLETLGERITPDEAKDLASQLPREIGYYLFRGNMGWGDRFDYHEFVNRVAYTEGHVPSKAAFHARAVMETVAEAVSPGEIDDIVQQLPPDFFPLFAGSSGNVRKAGKRERRGYMEYVPAD